MKIYLLSPVRNVTPAQQGIIDAHVERLEQQGHTVYLPIRDTCQDDEIGVSICKSHASAMLNCDRVDILWDKASTGSHVDLGMAYVIKKPLLYVHGFSDDGNKKSYHKVIKHVSENGYI